MSSSANTSQAGSTFLWVLGAFASFAVLFVVFQALGAKPGEIDPRAPERLANTAEISKAQQELLAKMGMNDSARKTAIYAKTLEMLKARQPAPSTQVVPGSPTQLKQAAAAAPVPSAPAAPAPAPATK